ncbi:ferritin-like domain-containing protein [Phycicoccus sonneratiae]|uniref:DUF2202 domain-containing protein n=1 Tax=Phycicoccus sonneratiae TaxID=2807628 RepID=A0ABS2CH62_9MICO|nr:DUF2202 domain-containing protein [Phycicoccus sonneraticus]MBM6399212.1 DUF2202 domain-containing protein [Phycicoccus sonneraticus]
MNRTIRTTAAALGAGALLAGGLAAGQAFGVTGPGTAPAIATSTAAATATPALTEALRFASDEERMARDLYAAIADRYDDALPFSRITTSEQRHLDAVSTLLARYGIADPSAGSTPGTYADTAVQDLYDTWWSQAQRSLDDAYDVGVALEQRDIADLETTIAADLPSDVDAVLANLLRGSRMHLRSFTGAANGETATGGGMMGGRRSSDGTTGRSRGGMTGRWGAGTAADSTGSGECPMLDD